MAISIYDVTVPVFKAKIPALAHVLKKGETDAQARGVDPQVYLQARLAPDMFNLTKQVQVCSDQVKGTLSRLTGQASPSWPDDEASFQDLYARLDKTLAYAKGFEREQFEGAETREVVITFPGVTFEFNGLDFVNNFALPNFYFHLTTAYDILRHNGVQIGKRDFSGG